VSQTPVTCFYQSNIPCNQRKLLLKNNFGQIKVFIEMRFLAILRKNNRQLTFEQAAW
jgi:hypothetical protein